MAPRSRSTSLTEPPITRRRTRSASFNEENEKFEELPPKKSASKRPKRSETLPIPEVIEEVPTKPTKKKSKKSEPTAEQTATLAESTDKQASINTITSCIKVVPGLIVDAVPLKSVNPIKNHVDKGRNVSGRGWKRTNQKRASTFMRNDKLSGASKSWTERQAEKQRREEIKDLEKQMKEEQRLQKQEARKVREERAAMRAANEMKNTVMQTITKTHKLKNMNKKQLRQIKKTAINAQTGQLELVSPWQK